MTNNIWKGVAVLGVLLGVIGIFLPVQSLGGQSFGSVGLKLIEQYDPYVRYNGGVNTALPFNTTSTVTIGTNGTAIPKIIFNSCSLIASSYTVAATSSVPMDCAITGITSTDIVQGWFASSTGQALAGWSITGSQASTTAGFATFSVTNLTGAAAIVPAKLASSTSYIVY